MSGLLIHWCSVFGVHGGAAYGLEPEKLKGSVVSRVYGLQCLSARS